VDSRKATRVSGTTLGSKGKQVKILALGTLIWPQGTNLEMPAEARKGVLSSHYGRSSVEGACPEIRKSRPKSTSLCGGFRVFWPALENRGGKHLGGRRVLITASGIQGV